MEPGDSKNYTCSPKIDVVGDSKNGSSNKQYKHYVIGTYYEYDYAVRVIIIIIVMNIIITIIITRTYFFYFN
jgi:hypothetical protein